MSGIKGFSIPNVANYGMLTTHESNAPLPVTRHQYRMTCNKDILQLSFEDLNQSMSPLKISYLYISSVTISSSNRHQVCPNCMLPRNVLLGHLDPWRQDRLVIPKRNVVTTLCCTQSQKIAGLKTCSISVSFRQENAKWWNIYIYVLWHYFRKCLKDKIVRPPTTRNWSCSLYSTLLQQFQKFLHL